jgi:hypothetical protein
MALQNLSAALKQGVADRGRIEGDTVAFDPAIDDFTQHSVFLALRIAQSIDDAPEGGEDALVERYRTQFGEESEECFSEFLRDAFDSFRRELSAQ